MVTTARKKVAVPSILFCLAGLALLVGGCQVGLFPQPTATVTTIAEPTAAHTPDNSPKLTAAALEAAQSPTAVLGFITPEITPTPTPALSTATPLPDPLRFVFPTQRPAPVSSWRPPGYPVPWAQTLNDHFYFSRPIAADQVNWPLQDYRYGGDFFGDIIHTGVDIPAPFGTPVLAVGPGKVVWAGYGLYRGYLDETDPYGMAVAIQHDFGWQNQKLFTVYGHLSEVSVITGQHLESGEQLGLIGETGRVTGPHLHFEVRLDENSFFSTRNPELWLVPPQGWGVLAGRVSNSGGVLAEDQNIIVTSIESGQNWFSRTYGQGAVIPDAYYKENLVIGDLPAGSYRIRIAYAGHNFEETIEILPGVVNYFYFYGLDGFKLADPPGP